MSGSWAAASMPCGSGSIRPKSRRITEVLSPMRELKKAFPQGVEYTIIYNPTIFIGKSVDEVIITIFVAILLVVGVVFLFLQSWRATIIPVVAIPVSLIGTFSILTALGISLNNLSLFGRV